MLVQGAGLKKTYSMGGTDAYALRGVDLEMDHGEFVAVMGPSGSGKSTLLHILGCLDRPSDGQYRLDGTAIESLGDADLSRLRNKKIGFVFQAFNLIPQHTILENVELPLIYGGASRRTRQETSLRILQQVGLGHKVYHTPTELSGGEAQRVAIARALAIEPLLLIADEPTGNLDSHTGKEIMDLFTDLNQRGTTILLVTHSKEVTCYAKRVIEMKDGQIIRDSRQVPGPAVGSA